MTQAPSSGSSNAPGNPFRAALDAQAARGLLRGLTPLEGAPGKHVTRLVDGRAVRCLNFASNNYLDLAGHPRLREAAVEAVTRAGTGSGGSRLLGGDLPLHGELEAALERYRPVFPGARALAFNTGFQANHTLISALGEALGGVFADKLVHASVADGLRALRAGGTPFHRFRHNDADHLEELLKAHAPARGGLVVTETLFSMDGDFAPLEALCALQKRYGFWMLLDEAHSTGGYPGLHACGFQGLPERTILMGAFGKALGSFGAYVLAAPEVRDYLVNFGRGFVFSTSLPPAVLGANIAALETAVDPKESWRPKHLAEISAYARAALARSGFEVEASRSARAAGSPPSSPALTSAPTPALSHIIPVILGEADAALRVSNALAREGFHAPAIRPPTVPEGTARLRLNLTAAFTREDIDAFVAALERSR